MGERIKKKNNWNFPKAHSYVHAFDDIKAKGASLNMDTKPNEHMHGPIKKIYMLMTNFKDFAMQVLT